MLPFRAGSAVPAGARSFALLCLLLLISCGPRQPAESMTAGHAIIGASDAVFDVAWKLSAEYQSINKGAFVDIVRGLNRELVDSLVNKDTDQIFLDRPLTSAESLAMGRQNLKIYTYPVAYYPVFLLVDTGNSVRSLDSAQLRSILTGEFLNWKSVGGPDLRITTYAPPAGEGAWQAVTAFYRNLDSVVAVECPTAQGMLDSSRGDPGALLIYARPLESAPVRRLLFRRDGAEIPANVKQILESPVYPFHIELIYVTSRSKQDVAAGYLTYAVSNLGQRRVMNLGYRPASVPVRVVKMRSN
ncbi:substrate-binding domain-containing protein [candidate division KSB1 bacterium]|nr:substrate-binding domain-containing protein [candidate division KSB1 bacterium]